MAAPTGTRPRTALICTDVQRDFLPGGALAVAHGDEVVPPLLAAAADADIVIASQDFHPGDHSSFADRGGSWPRHCVAGTEGAELHPEIARIADLVVRKATEPEVEAYSAFDGTGLAETLRERGIEHVIVGGLATDYCVRATALAAIEAGFETTLIAAASRAVDVEPGDGERAVEELRAAGAEVI